MNKVDYHYSGKSSAEALNEFVNDFLSGWPKFTHGFLRKLIVFSLVCDGCGAKVRMKNPVLLASGKWSGTNWHHVERLDFCSTCAHDGTSHRAVKDGAKPLGSYTFEASDAA